jgi:hypothetical protein
LAPPQTPDHRRAGLPLLLCPRRQAGHPDHADPGGLPALGGAARCTDPNDNQGRIWFVDADTGAELDSYKIPRAEDGTCTMHNFNFLPRRDGKNVLVSSAYTGGTTVVDVDALLAGASEADAEVGFFRAHGGNAWSSHWYNGHIYANDINRGVDILLLSDKARATTMKFDHFNPQTQLSLID